MKFCGACGTALANLCPSCGTESPAGFKFCGACGTSLTGAPAPAPAAPAPAAPEPAPTREPEEDA